MVCFGYSLFYTPQNKIEELYAAKLGQHYESTVD